MTTKLKDVKPSAIVDRITALSDDELDELCEAAEKAIIDGNGFGWLNPPPRRVLESYWRGVLLMPQRELFVARLDGAIVGSTQLLRPPPNNEAQAHAAQLTTFFIAPWARGHGLARGMLKSVEEAARASGLRQIDLDVRATQTAAIQLVEQAGYRRWGVKPRYAYVDGTYVDGVYYTKVLDAA
ncbi:MAG TPA: GNAT family N-acetyltransferase [Ferrovibrio sp.]|jgi:ribosomal protein S18 acetylase RimI-like enzyme|uniref:GNAT family N-acetyltransferase n=1 Tax=Ferrovibrio sp. TaxID=1917215 RepID=UPI002B4B510C|nr:GNAT family N-acetyltransferase [Ferrovibrio sp.]HLT76017.1 GNAT family N-acetyltransferase [Ferrovibrio sp.]